MMRIAAIAVMLAVPAAAQQAANAPAGTVRVLDKTTGRVADVTLSEGEAQVFGLLNVRMDECRYPTDNPSGDAYAHLTLSYSDDSQPIFNGWMIASAPALNPLDHPRYDVWLLRCKTS